MTPFVMKEWRCGLQKLNWSIHRIVPWMKKEISIREKRRIRYFSSINGCIWLWAEVSLAAVVSVIVCCIRKRFAWQGNSGVCKNAITSLRLENVRNQISPHFILMCWIVKWIFINRRKAKIWLDWPNWYAGIWNWPIAWLYRWQMNWSLWIRMWDWKRNPWERFWLPVGFGLQDRFEGGKSSIHVAADSCRECYKSMDWD